MEILAVLYFT